MPNRHSVFWRLALPVAAFCLAMIWASDHIDREVSYRNSFLSGAALAELDAYAAEAGQALAAGQPALVEWLGHLQRREAGLVLVVDRHLQPLPGQAPDADARRLLRFARPYDSPMSRRAGARPMVVIPLPNGERQLVMQLPERLRPWRHQALLVFATVYLPPVLLSVLFCWLLYRQLITPLERLRRQANALHGNRLDPPAPLQLSARKDELGDLGRAIDYLTRRLRDSIAQQQQLLRDLSHELRTPLSRLRVACESALPPDELRERVEREITGMQRLVDDTLALAWLDSEQSTLACEPVDVQTLWHMLGEDACFEAGWPRERIRSDIPPDCRVSGNLNALAQAMENVLRNAIRHSPAEGCVCLSARREGRQWRLSIDDQGPGVAEQQLERMFRPFTRLSTARPGGDGFGLGLAIARGMVSLQGGRIWAENRHPGLRVNLLLPAV
ncbi:sensor histidine kinase [Pseudomonas oligotrophica]|uniref:sensor histidine kinase n=1 Tax=Pseudomonas oligotrophica TaxID=2912055 RepID=UPI001F3E9A80|nr:sensor histidine kinase [Pseudomonas oligotrophica]MCF7202726.1 sensor histidine kinase [Pseudomonas oligotrophica]